MNSNNSSTIVVEKEVDNTFMAKESWNDFVNGIAKFENERIFPPSEVLKSENNDSWIAQEDEDDAIMDLSPKDGVFFVTRKSTENDKKDYPKISEYVFWDKNRYNSEFISHTVNKAVSEYDDDNYEKLLMKNVIDFPVTNLGEKECYYHCVLSINDFLMSSPNAHELLNNSFDKDSANISELRSLSEQYDDLTKYIEDLSNHAEGYNNIFEEELSEIVEKVYSIVESIVKDLEEKLAKNYFSYDDSLVEDLSLFNGFRCYLWDNTYTIDVLENNTHWHVLKALVKHLRKSFKVVNELDYRVI